MTKEEALEQLRLGPGINEDVSEEYNDAVDMAIKALEQQPSEDCVSRQAVLSKAELIELEDGQSFMSIDPEDVKALSPVTPTHCIATVKFSKDDLREICNERIEIECTHGTCKECLNHGISKQYEDIDGARYCSSFRTYTGYDFYCADFEKRGNENENN